MGASLHSPTPLCRTLDYSITRRTRRRRTVITMMALFTVLVTSRLHAQAVLGFGDDATTVPAGMLRVGFLNSWTRFEQRFTAPDGARIDTHLRIRRTPAFLELGVTKRLAVGVMAPSVGTFIVATYYPPMAAPGHADSLRMMGQSAIGDAEGWVKLVWLGAQEDSERTNPSGLHVRSSLTGLVRLGTGIPAHASRQLAIGTGDGQTDIEGASQWDFIFGRWVWMSVVGRYVRQLPTTRTVRVAPRDDPFATAQLVFTRIEPGNYYELEATPRLSLGQHFVLGAQYRHRHDADSHFTAAGGSGDPSILDVPGSSSTTYGFGVVYSTVASYAAGRTSLPFEVTLQYFRSDRWNDGVPPSVLAEPDRSTYAIGIRYYARLWGKR